METIRVLLGKMPLLLRESLRHRVEEQCDMKVVGEAANAVDLLVRVRESRAHVVILGFPEAENHGISTHLLAEFPDLLLVSVEWKKRCIAIPRQVLVFDSLGNISADELLLTIRKLLKEIPNGHNTGGGNLCA